MRRVIGLYLLSGIGFVTIAVRGFVRTRRMQAAELKRLTTKYT